MEIKEIDSKEVWEGFMAEVKPPTFLQSWNWGEFNAKTDHKVWRLGCYEHDQLVAVALVLKVTAKRGWFLFCPHGPVIKAGAATEQVIKALTDALVPIAKEEKCVFIRISPLTEHSETGNKAFTDIGYREAPIHMMHPELAWVLDIRPAEEQLLAGMRKTTRYSIKKAEKDGVVITTSSNPADLEKFYTVYKQTFQRQDFKPFARNYFETEAELFMKENKAMFFFAQYQGEIVGAAFIVFYGDSAFYHHGGTTRKFDKLTDAQLLQWNVIKEAKRRGLSFYNFWGVVPEDKRSNPQWGLSIFKRGFGGFEKHYVHAKDLVLSPRYWLTYTIEKVRKIKRRL